MSWTDTSSVFVILVYNSSQSSGTLRDMPVGDSVVCVFCPPSLVIVLKARIGFYEGGETEQAYDPGKPVTAHAQGRGCTTAPVSVPANDSS